MMIHHMMQGMIIADQHDKLSACLLGQAVHKLSTPNAVPVAEKSFTHVMCVWAQTCTDCRRHTMAKPWVTQHDVSSIQQGHCVKCPHSIFWYYHCKRQSFRIVYCCHPLTKVHVTLVLFAWQYAKHALETATCMFFACEACTYTALDSTCIHPCSFSFRVLYPVKKSMEDAACFIAALTFFCLDQHHHNVDALIIKISGTRIEP